MTVALYSPVRTYDFIRMDDPDYVVENQHVNRGLNLSDAGWAFTHRHSGNWHPVTWLSHALDCQLFGVKAGPHHLVNVGFQALNSVLLLLLLWKLTRALWRSSFVAASFAWHPLHVESVAWVAERKDVLSTFFFILTLWAYAEYVGGLDRCRLAATQSAKSASRWPVFAFWLLSVVLFALGLMSKPMLVTVPFVLMLMDFWPLGRLEVNSPSAMLASALRLVPEKLPFFALAAASSVVTIIVQQNSGAVIPLNDLPLGPRLANALVSYVRYVELMFVPTGLAVFYPLSKTINSWQVAWAGLLLLVISASALWSARCKPFFIFGWLWYLGTLVPVIGIIKAGEQAIADRYTYVPLIGLFIALAWGLGELAQRFHELRKPLSAAAIAGLVGCAWLTSRQLDFWKNSLTLYTHTDQVTRNNYVSCMVLGALLWEDGKLAEAKAKLNEGLKNAPKSPDLNNSLGFILIKENQFSEAQAHFEQALAITPDLEPARYGLGYCLFQQTNYVEAEAACRRAWELNPDDYKAGLLLGLALQSQHRPDEARSAFQQVLRGKPGCAPALRGLAAIASAEGDDKAAVDLYQQAVTAEPKDIEGLTGLASSLANSGKLREAADVYSSLLALDPNQAIAHCALAELLMRLNRPDEGIAHYHIAIRLEPDSSAPLNNLAWILATHPQANIRNGAEAVQLAEKACKLTQDSVPLFLGTLAACYAEAGRFDEAVAAAEKAISAAKAAGAAELADRNSQLLALYRSGKAYHLEQ